MSRRSLPSGPSGVAASGFVPTMVVTGRATLAAAQAGTEDRQARAAAHAADEVARAAEDAYVQALTDDPAEVARREALEAVRRDAARRYDVATGRACGADRRAAQLHREWQAAYLAAVTAGVSPATLLAGVERRQVARPGLSAPDTSPGPLNSA